MIQHLLDIGKHLLAESEVNQVLTTAIDGAIGITNAERGIIILFNEAGEMQFQTARHLKKEEIEHPEFEISRTIIDKVKCEQKMYYVDNALKDVELKDSPSTHRLNILSVICLPLCHRDEMFGIVYLDNRTVEGAFTQETCQFAESFTDFISLAAYRALERKKLLNRINHLERELRGKYDFENIIGHHPKMVKILKLVSQVAQSDATVLIQGESGTGKELIAQAIHFNSRRSIKPFIPINCSALSENLLESELFGHVKGAFTGAIHDKSGWFESADGGTIFLDEVSEMSPALQAKLLRVLQSGEYSKVGSTEIRSCNIVVLAATNKDLYSLVKKEKFREDLYYRLDVIKINLPPLRNRRSDIALLMHYFLKKYSSKLHKNVKYFSKEAEELLHAYDYPGNIRELENAIQCAVTLAEDTTIEPNHLPLNIKGHRDTALSLNRFSTLGEARRSTVERVEKECIINSLKESNGHMSNAAKNLGVDISNFHKKIKKYGINPQNYQAK